MSFGEAVLAMTLEHYLAFLLAGVLATFLFSYLAGPFLMNAGVSHTVRGIIYGIVILIVSFTYEYYEGMKDLFQVHAVTITLIALWSVLTLCLSVISVNLWRRFRDRKALNTIK